MTAVQELTALDATVERAVERLLSLQHPDGWWKGELESNATMIAEHLFLLHFLGLRDAETDRLLANELLARRRADGTWSIWFEGPDDLSVTVEAYTALKLAGVDAGDATRDYIQRSGGVARTRIFTRAFLALIGQWPWRRLAHVPVELVLLPAQGPLSVYDFACWARQTMVALSVVEALQPVRPSPVDLSEIGGRKTAHSRAPRLLPARRHAIRVAERWVRERQEADGSWGGIQPPWVWSLIMLAALGHGFEDETFARGFAGWERFMVRDGDRLRPEACQSPIWDTALAVLALRAAGLPAADPRLQAAGEWLLREEVTVPGDWAVRRPGLSPGGWAFEFDNDLYPDVDDTAVVVLALRELGIGYAAVRRGLEWTAGMQSESGGWGASDVDNEALWLYNLPICDFGKVTDEPTADVTAHALEALAHEGGYESSLSRGLAPEHSALRRAVAWLDSVQQPEGAFGEDIRSYADPAWRGRGAATPSQTAWALMAYISAGAGEALSARRAAEYLSQIQRPDGDWDEQHFTGTGFPLDFMIRYHLYRLTFPLLALGRLRERLNG